MRAVVRKRALQRTAQQLQADITAAESMLLKADLKHRLRVLRRLGHIEDSGLVTQKGHVRTATTAHFVVSFLFCLLAFETTNLDSLCWPWVVLSRCRLWHAYALHFAPAHAVFLLRRLCTGARMMCGLQCPAPMCWPADKAPCGPPIGTWLSGLPTSQQASHSHKAFGCCCTLPIP